MQFTKRADTYIVKLERGDDVIATLTEFCERHNVANATVSGIGAVEWVSCGYYELPTKEYHFTEYDELVEVVSMMGNVMLKDGKPFLHLHAVFTNTKNEAFGGHVKEMRVGVTLEVVIRPLDATLERHYDEEIGLFLIHCGGEV